MKKEILSFKLCSKVFIFLIVVLLFLESLYGIKALAFTDAAGQKAEHIVILNGYGEISAPMVFDGTEGPWYPGYSASKSFYIKNVSNFNCMLDSIKFYLKSLKNSNDGTNADTYVSDEYKKYMRARLDMDGSVAFSGTFKEMEDAGEMLKSSSVISSGQNKKFDLTISMDMEAGNCLEDLTGELSFVIQCSAGGEDIIIIPPEKPEDEPANPGDITPEINILPDAPPEPDIPEKPELPKTGSPIDTSTLIIAGSLLVCIGFVLAIKKNR